MSVLDAHAHVWDPSALPIDWVTGTPYEGPRLPSQVDDAGGAVEAWIFVEADVAADAEDEVAWVESLDWPGLTGIVAGADLAADGLAALLGRLGERPRVRGVRHLLQGEALGDERIAALSPGLRAVADAGLAFDVCVTWDQLAATESLLREAPGLTWVLDHLGKPPVDEGVHSPAGAQWLEGIHRLARLDGGFVKLSGLRAEASSQEAFDAHARGFVLATLDAFGARRCLYGSDWPVSTGADIGYRGTDWLSLVRDCAGDSWDDVAGGAARRAYGLR